MRLKDIKIHEIRHDQCLIIQTPQFNDVPKIEFMSHEELIRIMSSNKTRAPYLDSVVIIILEWDYNNKRPRILKDLR